MTDFTLIRERTRPPYKDSRQTGEGHVEGKQCVNKESLPSGTESYNLLLDLANEIRMTILPFPDRPQLMFRTPIKANGIIISGFLRGDAKLGMTVQCDERRCQTEDWESSVTNDLDVILPAPPADA